VVYAKLGEVEAASDCGYMRSFDSKWLSVNIMFMEGRAAKQSVKLGGCPFGTFWQRSPKKGKIRSKCLLLYPAPPCLYLRLYDVTRKDFFERLEKCPVRCTPGNILTGFPHETTRPNQIGRAHV